MDEAMLRADCARCAGLCCVALAFDRSELFAFDKAAGVACEHLTARDKCRIHAKRDQHGLAGCAAYDCGGAGQRVTQELFAGRSWREDPALARDMFDAFRSMRQVHELLQLLNTAGRLALTPEQAQRRDELKRALQPAQGWSPHVLAAFERGSVPAEVQLFLLSLQERLDPRRSAHLRLRVTR